MGEYLGIFSIGVLVAVGVVIWQRRRRAMRFDLRYWNDEPPGDADDDIVDEESGPYCRRCDHPNPPQTYFCQSCGQKIA